MSISPQISTTTAGPEQTATCRSAVPVRSGTCGRGCGPASVRGMILSEDEAERAWPPATGNRPIAPASAWSCRLVLLHPLQQQAPESVPPESPDRRTDQGGAELGN